MVSTRSFSDLALGAQTSYAELYDMVQAVEQARFNTLRGSFHRRQIKGRTYIYFNFRDADGGGRSVYVGPDSERVQSLVEDYEQAQVSERIAALSRRAQACMALGCSSLPERHFRILQKLASYGLFRSGAVLIGAHAFVALGNMLGIRWKALNEANSALYWRAVQDVCVAHPSDLDLPARETLVSLETGNLPIRELSTRPRAQASARGEPGLRIKMLASMSVADHMPHIHGLRPPLTPMNYMEFLLERKTRGVVFAKTGAFSVNLPDPARFAVHKIVRLGEKSAAMREAEALDIEQAASLIEWHAEQGRLQHLQDAWHEASTLGADWRRLASAGRQELEFHRPIQAAALS